MWRLWVYINVQGCFYRMYALWRVCFSSWAESRQLSLALVLWHVVAAGFSVTCSHVHIHCNFILCLRLFIWNESCSFYEFCAVAGRRDVQGPSPSGITPEGLYINWDTTCLGPFSPNFAEKPLLVKNPTNSGCTYSLSHISWTSFQLLLESHRCLGSLAHSCHSCSLTEFLRAAAAGR